MFNINLDLQNANELFKGPLGLFIIYVASMILVLFLGMSLGSNSKEEVCKEELKLIVVQRDQISSLEVEKAQAVSKHQTQCIEREREICRKEKEAIKINCNELVNRLFPHQEPTP
jgi:cytochrome c-type biogenesis protein CcmH/NrfG